MSEWIDLFNGVDLDGWEDFKHPHLWSVKDGVIRGETTHYDYVCGETARALQDLAVKYCLALGFGLLTVENSDQAEERAGVDRRDKGGEAARVCLSMIDMKRNFGLFPR